MAEKKLHRSWSLLIRRIEGLDSNCPPTVLAKELVSWLRSEPLIVKESIFLQYRFDEYLNINVDDHPVFESPLRGIEFDIFKRNLIRRVNGDGRNPYMCINGALERLFLRQVENECPRCGWLEASVYKDEESCRLVDACNQCGCARFKDGSKYTGGKLVFANNDDLRYMQ